ncbi:hypothetical protein GCM10022199_23610 [Marihabitans asiaticum]|uniref:Uncharacterized protein n=1 Tax=Marihabitans asiaticum TaxID=415218 RepID=A0A560W9W9_9MICO|nr:hypothetical protein [Marihabitans asiaticum]TWD14418.1 hypothetical protein FB557_1827 [Marihabitans asiaticum]
MAQGLPTSGLARWTGRPAGRALVVLLVLDAIFIAAHVFGYYGLNVLGPRWSISTDGGFPEIAGSASRRDLACPSRR